MSSEGPKQKPVPLPSSFNIDYPDVEFLARDLEHLLFDKDATRQAISVDFGSDDGVDADDEDDNLPSVKTPHPPGHFSPYFKTDKVSEAPASKGVRVLSPLAPIPDLVKQRDIQGYLHSFIPQFEYQRRTQANFYAMIFNSLHSESPNLYEVVNGLLQDFPIGANEKEKRVIVQEVVNKIRNPARVPDSPQALKPEDKLQELVATEHDNTLKQEAVEATAAATSSRPSLPPSAYYLEPSTNTYVPMFPPGFTPPQFDRRDTPPPKRYERKLRGTTDVVVWFDSASDHKKDLPNVPDAPVGSIYLHKVIDNNGAENHRQYWVLNAPGAWMHVEANKVDGKSIRHPVYHDRALACTLERRDPTWHKIRDIKAGTSLTEFGPSEAKSSAKGKGKARQ